VRYFRLNQPASERRNLGRLDAAIFKAEYISGPMSLDLKAEPQRPDWPHVRRPLWNQICVRSEILAAEFNSHVKKAVFIKNMK